MTGVRYRRSVGWNSTRDVSLPPSPKAMRIMYVTFRTCPGSSLRIHVVHDETSTRDATGVCSDSWWSIECTDLPARTFRLMRGAHSLVELLKRYGFQDGEGCVHHRDAVIHYGDDVCVHQRGRLEELVPHHMLDCCGVPQFYRNSGVCWFASLCWSGFANQDVLTFLTRFMPDDESTLCRRALRNQADAEKLRKCLWYKYRVGDNVEDPPEMDGKNGCNEFICWCAQLGVPLIQMEEHRGMLHHVNEDVDDQGGQRHKLTKVNCNEPHLLVLRFQDGKHSDKVPLHRRIKLWNHRYRLVGLYMGQRKCGHQIGMSCSSKHWRDWSLGDADLHKDGIGPIHIHFSDNWKHDWWKAWRVLVHVTKYGVGQREFCPINPHNVANNSLDSGTLDHRTSAPGTCSVDALYFFDGSTKCNCTETNPR